MPYRKQTGFSLPTVVALGVVASLWMLGTAQLIVPSIGHLTKDRTDDLERSSAEAALDWSIQQLNNSSTRASVDNQSNIPIPSAVLSSGATLQGHVSIQNIAAPHSSYLYDPLSDTNNSAAALPPGNGWRVVTATVTPQFGAGGKSVRVILKPMYAQTLNTVTTQSQGPPTPLFNFSAFAIGQVNGNGNMSTNSYDSRLTPTPTTFDNTGADVGTNGQMGFIGNAFIGGNMDVWSAPSSAETTVASGTSNVYVNGNIDANGQVSNFNHVNGQITAGDNHAQQQLPAAPSAPAGSTSLGTISLSGNSRMTLTAGNYVVNSINITGNAQLVVDSSSGPVNIYVQGAGSNDGIAIAGNGIYNGGVPANLRIWYSGTGPTQIAGNGTFTGVVYAPNSTVSISGNGEQYGAMVGNTINFNGNGQFHYDRALAANNQLMWNPPVYTTSTNATNYLAFFQAVSWEEF